MKLINKTNRNFIAVILVVLPISCLLLFFSLNYYISDEVDEKMRVDEMRIIEQLKKNPAFISLETLVPFHFQRKQTKKSPVGSEGYGACPIKIADLI